MLWCRAHSVSIPQTGQPTEGGEEPATVRGICAEDDGVKLQGVGAAIGGEEQHGVGEAIGGKQQAILGGAAIGGEERAIMRGISNDGSKLASVKNMNCKDKESCWDYALPQTLELKLLQTRGRSC